MCPPSSEDSLLARNTVATAFHRISDRIRCSIAPSPGCGGCACGGIVFRYGVFAEYGTGTPFRRATPSSSSNKNSARSAPLNSMTESNASRHSLVSTGSRSLRMGSSPLPGQSGACGCLADGCVASETEVGFHVLEGLRDRMAGDGVLGKRRGLLVVHHGRLVERVLPAEHTLRPGPNRARRPLLYGALRSG